MKLWLPILILLSSGVFNLYNALNTLESRWDSASLLVGIAAVSTAGLLILWKATKSGK